MSEKCENCGDAVTREDDELVGSDGEVTCPDTDRPHGPAVRDHQVTKWTAKALTRQCLLELDKEYDLTYVSYDDKLGDEQVNAVVAGDWSALWDSNEEWIGDMQYAYSKEAAEELSKDIAQRWERTFDIDSDDLLSEWDGLDEVQEAIRERDTSDPWKILAGHTGKVLMRQLITDEDSAWGYRNDLTATEVIKDLLEHAEPGTVLKRNQRNVKVVRDVLAEAGVEWGYKLGMIVYAVDVGDLYDMGDVEYVDVTNPYLYIGNPFMGDGYCDGPLHGTFRIKRSELTTDKGAFGYGWDEVAGVYTSAYEAEVKAVPKPTESTAA